MTAEEIVVALAGIQLICSTFFLTTTGAFYTIAYKILPFFLGLGCLWSIRSVYM